MADSSNAQGTQKGGKLNPLYLAGNIIGLPPVKVQTTGGEVTMENTKNPGDPVHLSELADVTDLDVSLDRMVAKGTLRPTDPENFRKAADKLPVQEHRERLLALVKDDAKKPTPPAGGQAGSLAGS